MFEGLENIAAEAAPTATGNTYAAKVERRQ